MYRIESNENITLLFHRSGSSSVRRPQSRRRPVQTSVNHPPSGYVSYAMVDLRPLACLLILFAAISPARGQQPSAISPAPTADAIMARVAANQDRAQAARAHYVYVQHARVASLKGRTVRCVEVTDSRITPSPSGSTQQLLKLDGKLLHKGKYISYNKLRARTQDSSTKADNNDELSDNDDTTDRDLVENMRETIIDSDSKDGIDPSLFPLTSKSQADLEFKLLGRAPMNGRDTFHIEFKPRDKNDLTWKGDAYIDAVEFQPVLVRTKLSRNLPLGVRVLLGTDVPGLGFTITYAPQKDGVWFPESFGTEFKVHILFFFRRQITLSAENRDFDKTHVTSRSMAAARLSLRPTLKKSRQTQTAPARSRGYLSHSVALRLYGDFHTAPEGNMMFHRLGRGLRIRVIPCSIRVFLPIHQHRVIPCPTLPGARRAGRAGPQIRPIHCLFREINSPFDGLYLLALCQSLSIPYSFSHMRHPIHVM